jgi:hypothetical protein
VRFSEDENYISKLKGRMWIDAEDRIVVRLAAWPAGSQGSENRPPAAFMEMTRLPVGVWLPKQVRLDGVDYPEIFEENLDETSFAYSEYRLPRTDVKSVNVAEPPVRP